MRKRCEKIIDIVDNNNNNKKVTTIIATKIERERPREKDR